MQGFCTFGQISFHMIRYTSQFQTKFEEFCSLYQLQLDPNNRWVQLAHLLPWDRMVGIYARSMDPGRGAGTVSPRVLLGALVIKHRLGLSDRETLQTISENPYMQFFLGLDNYHPGPLFSPSLLVEVRKRLSQGGFDLMGELAMRKAHPGMQERPSDPQDKAPQPNRGRPKVDATVADQCITYPNDLALVDQARLKTERIIDELFELLRDHLAVKPRTYRKVAQQRYLAQAKKRKQHKAALRKTLRYLLNCVERNLGHIERMLDMLGEPFPLPTKYLRQLWVVRALYDQQRGMYQQGTNTWPDRIVSISQPHVRPIVRGKAGKKVEFGAKLGLSLIDGYLVKDTLSWDPYNEAGDLKGQAEAYRLLMGHYPELIQADKIYATNENRTWCRDRGIRLTATPKGRQPELTPRQKRKRRDEYAQRNHIEGRIGNAKQAYSLDQIGAKLKSTSEAWIAATLFVVNLSRFAQDLGANF